MERRGFVAALVAVVAAPAAVLAGERRAVFPRRRVMPRYQIKSWEGNTITVTAPLPNGEYTWYRVRGHSNRNMNGCYGYLEPVHFPRVRTPRSFLPRNYKSPARIWWEAQVKRWAR